MSHLNGALVISLDFEMMWGCHDWATVDGYGKTNISNVGIVVNRLLDLFEKYHIHATFATVGMLMFKNKEDLLRSLPDVVPSYRNENLSPYKRGFIENITAENTDLFFAPGIIERLKAQSGIEIGSHTFSHFYCWEDGQTAVEFDRDIECAVTTAKQNGVANKSLVFPKNNITDEYLKIVARHGFLCYRGNPVHFFDRPNNSLDMKRQRVLRLLDNYIPLTDNTYSYSSITSVNGVLNIRASRFFRPYNQGLKWLEALKNRRIKKEILRAARKNEVYHIWWHPHNFGADTDKNLNDLEKILQFYSKCRETYGMMSLTMEEVADYVNNTFKKRK